MSAVPVSIGVRTTGRGAVADASPARAKRPMPRPASPLVDTLRARAPRPAHLAHRPLLAALHVLHAGAGQRVARAVQHPDARRDRARRTGRRGGRRHDVPAHRRRAAAAHRHRRGRATARGDRRPGRRARRARDDDERHPAAGAASRPRSTRGCGGSTSRSTRCGATGSASSRAAIGSTTCSRGSPRPRHPVFVRSSSTPSRCAMSTTTSSSTSSRSRSTTAPRCGSSSRCRSTPVTPGIARAWSRATRSSTRSSARWTLTPVPGRGGAPAERWMLDGGPATVGVIASVTAPFCGDCDRLRLTADGQLRNCLFSTTEYDLLPILREPGGDSTDAEPAGEASVSDRRSIGCCAPASAASSRSRDQRPVVPAARARHERDRRLSAWARADTARRRTRDRS